MVCVKRAGFYSVCPGTDQYVIGSPLFKKITITLENVRSLQLRPIITAVKTCTFNLQP